MSQPAQCELDEASAIRKQVPPASSKRVGTCGFIENQVANRVTHASDIGRNLLSARLSGGEAFDVEVVSASVVDHGAITTMNKGPLDLIGKSCDITNDATEVDSSARCESELFANSTEREGH